MGGNKEDMMKEGLKLRGDVIIERRRKNGAVIEREELKNLIVNVGKERVAKLLSAGEGGTAFGYIAIGESGSGDSVSATDTSLLSEVKRVQADDSGGSYEADYKAIWETTFSFGSAESYAIKEAGISDSASESGQTLLDRFIFSAKNVDADVDLYVKVTVQVS